MTEKDERGAAQALMRDMGLTEASVERRKKAVALEPADLARISAIRGIVNDHVDEYTASFFEYMSTLEEGRALTTSRALLERARDLKRKHLLEMVSGEYGLGYVEHRLELGFVYASVGLSVGTFVGAFRHLLHTIGISVAASFEGAPREGFDDFLSLEKVAFFDLGVIVDVMAYDRERTIRQQQEAIRELSTPVLQVRDRLLLLPIIGVIDTQRARLITDALLHAIRANRAKVVVMDVTGVATIDSKVANHILQTVTAAKLMGARVIVTGLSSDVAQSLAALGIELSKLTTVGDLQGGLEEAEQVLGYRLSQTAPVRVGELS